MTVDRIADLMLLTSLLPYGGFLLLYLTRSNWRSTAAGRSLAYVVGAIVAILLLVVYAVFSGPIPPAVRLMFYASFQVAGYGLLVTLVRKQRLPRADTARRIGRPLDRRDGQ